MVIEPKTAQPVELDEEPIDLFGLTNRGVQKPFIYSRTLFQPIK